MGRRTPSNEFRPGEGVLSFQVRLRPISRISSAAFALLSILAISVGPARALSQDAPVRTFGAEPTCSNCRLDLEHIGIIADSDDDPWMGEDIFVSQDRHGRFYATSFDASPGVVSVIDRSGQRVDRFGRQGEGPGEGRWVRPPAFRGDTAYVYDPMLGRMTVWSPGPGREVLRTMRVPARLRNWMILDSGELIMTGLLNTRDAIGYPVHVVTDDRVTRSFGNQSPAFRADAAALSDRRVALSNGGRLWIAHRRRYVIELWNIHGTKLRELRVDADWFPPWDGERTDLDTQIPPPQVNAIREDDTGLLWVFVHVADENFHENRRQLEDSGTGMGPIVRPWDRSDLRDTIVHVIDPKEGIVAAARFDRYLFITHPDGPLLSSRLGPDLQLIRDAYRVNLVRPTP